MSRLLIDTQALLWALSDDPRLSRPAAAAVEEPDADLLVSVASLWEIGIKFARRKLTLGVPLDELLVTLDQRKIELLPIAPADALSVAQLPHHHDDPFDRILATQALRNELAIVSVDRIFDAYGVRRIW